MVKCLILQYKRAIKHHRSGKETRAKLQKNRDGKLRGRVWSTERRESLKRGMETAVLEA